MSDNYRSESQINASRENGKLSHGPVTEEGKARSSKNAMKHGFYSSQVVLSNECQDRYDNLLAKYVAAFKPAGQPEYDLVVRMTNSAWRLRRLWAMETALIDAEYAILRGKLDPSFDKITAAHRAGESVLSIAVANTSGLEHIRKHEDHLDRQWHRACNALIKLQTLRLGEKPVLAYTPDSIEPDDYQNNFTEPEEFAFLLTFLGRNQKPAPQTTPITTTPRPEPKPDLKPKAA
ncbi:MAG: hypothetical protein HY820_44455 [Acidobacteria bacterium]|nr:hypothetical protein [Acidobacteriota bacterium]